MTHPNEQNLPLSTRFQPGSSGNKGGRPTSLAVRSRNAAAATLAVLEATLDRALSGDPVALSLILRQADPPGQHSAPPAGQTLSAGSVVAK